MLRCMALRERRLDRGRRVARRALIAIGEELRDARLLAGLTQGAVGHLVGLSHSQISRIEHGLVPGVSFQTLAMIGSVLGLDIPLRAYPNEDPVRDAAQLALLARFRALLPRSLRHRTEVPLGIPGDRRAWDNVIDGPGWSLPVEAETRLRDTQALRRKLALKCSDAGAPSMLLVLADTRHNRHVLRQTRAEFAEAFPVPGREALTSLRAGRRPRGGAIVLV
jgi:transcriptional regulator with XRE-family HTH domain